jgi:hypothetical protein
MEFFLQEKQREIRREIVQYRGLEKVFFMADANPKDKIRAAYLQGYG